MFETRTGPELDLFLYLLKYFVLLLHDSVFPLKDCPLGQSHRGRLAGLVSSRNSTEFSKYQ